MKNQATDSKLLIHFAIGFIVYQIIGNIVSSMVNTYFEENSYELFMKYGEDKVYIVYFLCIALVIQSIATFLSTRSLYNHFEIRKAQKNKLVLSIAIFFGIISLITGALNSEKFMMVFIINAIVLLLLLLYVYIKISSIVVDSSTYQTTNEMPKQPINDEVSTVEPIQEQPVDKPNIKQKDLENTRFNPLTGSREQRPIQDNQNPFEQPTQQQVIPNPFEPPVEQPQQENNNYLDIFTNPINSNQSNQVQNNNEQK